MIALSVKLQGEKRLAKLLKGNGKQVRREMKIAVNATAKQTVGIWAKAISKEIAVTQRVVKGTIKVTKKADERWITSTVTQRKEWNRIPLKQFNPKQTSAGVSYKVSRYAGKGFLPSGFIVQSLGGHVFKRDGPKVKMTKGKSVGKRKQRIFKQYGPSPWGVSIKNNLKKPVSAESRKILIKQIDRRIRAVLKRQGAI
jgi:hypothetical protein